MRRRELRRELRRDQERRRDVRLRPLFRPLEPERLRGTFAPFRRASARPIAIACLRLFTLGWRPFPPLRVPRFLRRIALSTLFDAPRPYFRLPDDFLRVAMPPPVCSACSALAGGGARRHAPPSWLQASIRLR
jgi:hypothetical protein